MCNFVERLQKEKNEVYFRSLALRSFIGSEGFAEVDEGERGLLVEQLEVMNRYYCILNIRISKYLS